MIAPLLIIQRVASKSASVATATISGNLDLLEAGSQREFTGGDWALPSGNTAKSVDGRGMNSSGELGVRVETTIDLHRDGV